MNKNHSISRLLLIRCQFYIVITFSGESYAERRKQLIQESKYLGGDMEHTHLVKGLDYALLEKVCIRLQHTYGSIVCQNMRNIRYIMGIKWSQTL